MKFTPLESRDQRKKRPSAESIEFHSCCVTEKQKNPLEINDIGDGRGNGKERRDTQRIEQSGTNETESEENHILCLSSSSSPCGPLPLITATFQQILLEAAVAPMKNP